jgi:hypothetical protein
MVDRRKIHGEAKDRLHPFVPSGRNNIKISQNGDQRLKQSSSFFVFMVKMHDLEINRCCLKRENLF